MGLLVVRLGDRIPLAFRTALVVRLGDRIPLAFAPDGGGPPDPPDPEIVGDLTAGVLVCWGGLEPLLRSVQSRVSTFVPVLQRASLPWGGLGAQVSRLAIVWGGLQLQRAGQSTRWAASADIVQTVMRSPWSSNPVISNARAARWASSKPLVQRSSAMPWTVPPSHAQAARIVWGGLASHLRAAGAPWTVPPKFEAPMHIRWGYGHGLEWVVRPPKPEPETPPPTGPKYGRTVALAFKCRKYIHHGQRVPLRFGNLACYAARDQQRAYIVLNEIEVVRLPDLLPIKVDAIGLSGARDAWCWDAQLQLADPGQLADVQPTVDGPRKLRITINGYPWVIAVEAFDKSETWEQKQVSISGRSASAQLAEPYAAARSRETANARTMHQLADAEVDGSEITLQYDGVSWLVTAGAWYYDSLTPMAALLRIAEASGSVVQSHPSEPEVRIVPRYPVSPWAWPETAPDVEIQDDIVTGTRLQLQSRPNFDAVIVAGERVGVAARVKREGSAGQTYAPQQVDQLITHADGARERGRNVLSDRGGQATIEHDIPLFSAPLSSGQPGLVLPLQLVRRVAGEGTWHGLATAVRINAALVKTATGVVFDVTQTVTIERHYTDAD